MFDRENIRRMRIIQNKAVSFSFLTCQPCSIERQECQMPPTDMVIIFKLVRFEIMTSFVCLIPSNNPGLSTSFTLTGRHVRVLHVCVRACLPTCVHLYVCLSALHSHMCECLRRILRVESERRKPLMCSSSHFQRNFIVNGAQKCTCLGAIRGIGISLPLCSGCCMPLVEIGRAHV